MKKSNLICIANIGKPRGLKGEFYINSFCSPPENIIEYKKHILCNDHNIEFDYIKKNNSKFLAKIKDINNVDDIKRFTNINLYIPSRSLPELPSDQIYWHDLVGMKVIGINKNEILGEVKEVNNFGANDCLVIKPINESVDDKERLIPFIKETFIKLIDKKEKILKVNWQSDY